MDKKYKIIGLVMERNEELILEDTLNHLAKFTDGLIVFDDASEDSSVEIAKLHPDVIEVIENKEWNKNRLVAETQNRQRLLEIAKKYDPLWIFYADADERFVGDIKGFLMSLDALKYDGIRISLFDAYLTVDDKKPYQGGKLLDFRHYFGSEKRDVLMIWRNKPEVRFEGLGMREPIVKGNIIIKFYCQHFGKALSVDHWEETCDYYAKYVPPLAEKWRQRKGKAIHTESDFGTPLYTWEQVVKLYEYIFR